MSNDGQKLSVVEKVGYSLGDAAANFIFQTMLIFLLSFYTDVFGITAAAAGTLFLVARIGDAVFDFGMGAVADRTNTRWGKFRPWILWTAIPFGLLGYLTFTTPNLSPSGKLAYAYVTYIAMMLIYSANNIPYSALMGVLTGDVVERTSLASYRFVSAMTATLVIQGLTLPLARAFGQVNIAHGYQMTMALFCALAVLFFVITFATTRERVAPDPRQKTSIAQDVRDLLQNRPWVVLFCLTLFVFLDLSQRGAALPYYFRYYVTEQREAFGFALFGLPLQFDQFSLFNAAGIFANIIGIFFSKPLATRFGKRNTFLACLFIASLFTIVFLFLPRNQVGLIIWCQVLMQLAYGPTIPLLWAMMADVADYSEWRTGRRATGIAFSATVFGLKFGLGVGGALTGWLLAQFGYVANVEQTAATLNGIRYLISVIPGVFFLLGVIALYVYPITLEMERRIGLELNDRRKRFQAA
jgi:GPH family glycoside/pentoside/hexuronide:cation symporter